MFILIGLGGALGAITRFLLGRWVSTFNRTNFPWATWIINSTGSFLLGLLFSYHTNGLIAEQVWGFLAIGFLGAYTTFSTFSYELLTLLQQNQRKLAFVYMISSVVISLIFAWIGMNL